MDLVMSMQARLNAAVREFLLIVVMAQGAEELFVTLIRFAN